MINLGTLFGTSTPPLVGLDISTSGVRLVELAMVGKGELRLERYASEPLARGAAGLQPRLADLTQPLAGGIIAHMAGVAQHFDTLQVSVEQRAAR